MSTKAKKIKRVCPICGKEFYVLPCKIRQVYCSRKCRNKSFEWRKRQSEAHKGKKLSREHRKKLSLAISGKKHWHWKGGIARQSRDGRVLIKCPDHPYAKENGYVYRYRLVMEAHLGRHLLPTEVVHHINGDAGDDRIENLMLFSSGGEHTKYEERLKREARSGIY